MSERFFNPLCGVPLVESPFFERQLGALDLDDETRRIATELHRDGLSVFEFPDEGFDGVARSIVADLEPRYDWTDRRRDPKASIRLTDGWRNHAGVRRIAINPKVVALLETLYGRRAIPFQTLNFPVGTQQHHHSDAIHFTSFPERWFCGVWVALEDTDENNGPLYYYPGSHRLPVYTHEHTGSYAPGRQEHYEPVWNALIEHHGLEKRSFHARRGQAAIWAANLLHGGATQLDPARTRHSQATHYYFEGCLYYTPHHSDPMRGVIRFKDVVDIRTGNPVPQVYVREVLPEPFTRSVQPPDGYPWSQDDRPDASVPADFDPNRYLAANPDVARAGLGAVFHYKYYGRREGRRLR
jgi:hypothetical protein